MMSSYSYPSSSSSPSTSSSNNNNNLRQHFTFENPYQLTPVGSCGNFHVLSPSSSNGRLPSWMHNNSRPRSKPHSRGRDKWTAALRSKGRQQNMHNQPDNIISPSSSSSSSSQAPSFIPSPHLSSPSSSSSLSNSIFLPSTLPPRAYFSTPVFRNNNSPHQPTNQHKTVVRHFSTNMSSSSASSPTRKKAKLASHDSAYSYPSWSPSSPISLSPLSPSSPSSSTNSSPASSPSSPREPSFPCSPSSSSLSSPTPSSYLSIQHIISPSSSPEPVSSSLKRRSSPLDLLCLCALSNSLSS
eukprot:TRINITY_DN6797_c0_g2_i1.p1 TRINITY_DN6797_c0_g2~~TRINITY_DN6797_c0_g2_i1.p1  ORF type:complete len:333 (-),score=108.29 TRINITY_DN6797_c0_g2_i1:82-975(-)